MEYFAVSLIFIVILAFAYRGYEKYKNKK